MKESHSLALIVAYYLSRFDRVAYRNLGFTSSTAAHKEIGRLLSVKASSVQNMRDEFDPIHANPRVGWYQRPLRPSRAKVVEFFQDLSQEELCDVVLEILANPDSSASENFADIIEPISTSEKRGRNKSVYIIRGPTGRRAEEIFIEHHKTTGKPHPGILTDMRDQGCGYDFEIRQNNKRFQIEVKGLDSDGGGIVFTSKEWDVAKKKRNTYFLVVVRDVSSIPTIHLIQNPGAVLRATKKIFTTVQIQWNVDMSDLIKHAKGQNIETKKGR